MREKFKEGKMKEEALVKGIVLRSVAAMKSQQLTLTLKLDTYPGVDFEIICPYRIDVGEEVRFPNMTVRWFKDHVKGGVSARSFDVLKEGLVVFECRSTQSYETVCDLAPGWGDHD